MQHTFSVLINSLDDICCGLQFVVVAVVSIEDDDVETVIISGSCEIESMTRLDVVFEILFGVVAVVVVVVIAGYTYG